MRWYFLDPAKTAAVSNVMTEPSWFRFATRTPDRFNSRRFDLFLGFLWFH
jgi:hypothetical protein